MEIRPVGAELIHAGGRTGGQDEGNRRLSATRQTHLKLCIRTGKGKAVPQGPQGSRRLRPPDFLTIGT